MTISALTYLYIALGGALGACLRFFINQESTRILGLSFPFGTLIVNIIGSFSLGFLYAWLDQHQEISDNMRLGISVGLLGALTTFSTFSFESFLLIQEGAFFKAILNILLNITVCLFSVWIAINIVKG